MAAEIVCGISVVLESVWRVIREQEGEHDATARKVKYISLGAERYKIIKHHLDINSFNPGQSLHCISNVSFIVAEMIKKINF